MTDYRMSHACARIKRSGRDYLVGVGGVYGTNLTGTNTIEFYDLTSRPTSWEIIPGVILPVAIGGIFGSKITVFDEGICEAFFISSGGIGFICSGNYTWSYSAVPNVQWGALYFPVVDANLLGGDTVW